jgi:hypothetical protein
VTVSPERLSGWLDGFTRRHGTTTTAYDDSSVTLVGDDGAEALVEVPFPPLAGDLVEHVQRTRTIGVLLARKGGHAAGVFVGAELVSSKVGSRHVQGRTAAGGWSQQRFARRREGQADVASQAAADVAVRILLAQPLDAVVIGGERGAVDAVLADKRLAALVPLVSGRLLDVPDPRLTVLQKAPFRDVWIRVREPSGPVAPEAERQQEQP